MSWPLTNETGHTREFSGSDMSVGPTKLRTHSSAGTVGLLHYNPLFKWLHYFQNTRLVPTHQLSGFLMAEEFRYHNVNLCSRSSPFCRAIYIPTERAHTLSAIRPSRTQFLTLVWMKLQHVQLYCTLNIVYRRICVIRSNKVNFFLLIYFNNHPLRVSNRLTIHHQGVFYCIWSIWYLSCWKYIEIV